METGEDMKTTPKWLGAFREAYRERLGRIGELRSSGKSWDEVRGALEAEDARLSGQSHQRWRNEWWLAARDGARPKD